MSNHFPREKNHGAESEQSEDNHIELDFSLVLASSVHDMKNSLGMLLNSLEEVIEDSPPENEVQNKRFSILQYEASRINSELIQLLTIYRIQNQHLPFTLDENYISETFEDQVARNDVLFRTKDITLEMDCDPDLPWFYDNELIGNVIHNVLINAARYAKEKIRLSADVEDNWLVIHIEDDGNGFPPFMINAEPLSEETEHNPNSTQLGLFFAAKIAHFHRQGNRRGRIELSNGGAFDGGVFSIYLP